MNINITKTITFILLCIILYIIVPNKEKKYQTDCPKNNEYIDALAINTSNNLINKPYYLQIGECEEKVNWRRKAFNNYLNLEKEKREEFRIKGVKKGDIVTITEIYSTEKEDLRKVRGYLTQEKAANRCFYAERGKELCFKKSIKIPNKVYYVEFTYNTNNEIVDVKELKQY